MTQRASRRLGLPEREHLAAGLHLDKRADGGDDAGVRVGVHHAARTGGDAVASDEDVVAADEPLVAPEGVVEISADGLARSTRQLRLGLGQLDPAVRWQAGEAEGAGLDDGAVRGFCERAGAPASVCAELAEVGEAAVGCDLVEAGAVVVRDEQVTGAVEGELDRGR